MNVERYFGHRFIDSLDRTIYDVPMAETERVGGKLRSILDENILPFWFPHCLDLDRGGYRCECSMSGEWQTVSKKTLVSQSRILWFISRLINFGRKSDDNVRWARHGFEFLRDTLWDQRSGGFYWEVDAETRQPTRPDKHLYGQAFALYGLSEFALATGDTTARSMADDLFETLETRAHDDLHGGYHEFFSRDWGSADPDEPSYMGHPPTVKQLNTHVHLLEAFTRYLKVHDSELLRRRLTELIQIQSSTVVTKQGGGCTDVFSSEWQRHPEEKFRRVTYGHDVENIWLLIEANRAVGASNTPFLEVYEQLFLSALRYGWDRTNFGFYLRGRLLQPARNRAKIWWTQAEALLCSLYMYVLTRQGMYFEIFDQTLSWIDRHQVDWSNGEWFEQTDKSGTPSGAKAIDSDGRWKTPYHGGRAVIYCLELLDRLEESPGT